MQKPTLDFFQYPIFPALPNKQFFFEGTNERHIALIGKDILQNEQLAFLDKILAAIQLERSRDAACVDIQSQQVHFADLLRSLKPKTGILFGILPNELGWRVQLPLYEWTEWLGTKWLLAHSLADLQGKMQPFKKNLWACLQAMYSK